VHVFSLGDVSSGIPAVWAAGESRAGVNLLPDLGEGTCRAVGGWVRRVKEPGDLAIASIHWGGNWGFEVPGEHVAFAHRLIDLAGIDVVHGHSSHHVKGIEVYRDRPIIYGCGDFIDDYEGINGYEGYRGDLGLMYFADMDAGSGRCTALRLVPTRVRRFRVGLAPAPDVRWLRDTLNREGARFGTSVEEGEDRSLVLRWA
jgi:poly-gamma-glutamate synthesis protein (capsule biosynthesis protein)